MPWCPNCNKEYPNEITICTKCNETLVSELAKETPTTATDFMPQKTLTYVKKADQYEDYNSTFIIFMTFGIAGLIFTTLNIIGIFHLFTLLFQQIILTILSIILILVAIRSKSRATILKQEISTEQETIQLINLWLKEHITPQSLACFEEDSLAPEIIFLHKIDYIKEELLKHFNFPNETLADELIEEFYNHNFDN